MKRRLTEIIPAVCCEKMFENKVYISYYIKKETSIDERKNISDTIFYAAV